ncbi:MAG: SDR family NAD(P)-dependent oxidoreductase [Pseudomonadales bacterium]
MKTFSNKVAAITGAGSGMGRALAVALANRGCHLAISDVNGEALEATAAQLDSARVNVSRHVLDVADQDAVFTFASATERDHGKVNLVFNNAGVSVTDSVEHMSYKDFEWLMNINFWGVVHGCKAFLPLLKRVDEGHIINTSSIFGVIAVPSQSAYNASKFAVRGFSEALRQELQDSHIGVTCVQPGGVKTNIVKTSRYYPQDNAAPTKEEAAATFESIAALSSTEAAEIILHGVAKNRARVLVGKDAKLIDWVARIFPQRYPVIMQWLSARMGADQLTRGAKNDS